MNEIKITPEEIGKAAELIRKVAEGTTQPAEPLTSWEIAKIFQSTHTRIFNRISRFYNAEASEDEKKEFEIAYRPYRNQRKHPIWKLSEKGCQLYIEKICAEEKRSKAFVEGLGKAIKQMQRLSLEIKNTMKFTFLSMRTAKLTESLIACQCRSHGQELPMMRRRELVFQRERDGIL